MNKQQIKGSISKVKGKIKVKASSITEDESLKTEGKMDYLSGSVLQFYGNTKDKLFKSINKFLDSKW